MPSLSLTNRDRITALRTRYNNMGRFKRFFFPGALRRTLFEIDVNSPQSAGQTIGFLNTFDQTNFSRFRRRLLRSFRHAVTDFKQSALDETLDGNAEQSLLLSCNNDNEKDEARRALLLCRQGPESRIHNTRLENIMIIAELPAGQREHAATNLTRIEPGMRMLVNSQRVNRSQIKSWYITAQGNQPAPCDSPEFNALMTRLTPSP
ncbi:MAG: hypothetical protein OJI67_07785, partial [Prosthecobacter sp.]|nr:hypothetical protein [Prosthecobacter sp.]